MKNLTQKTISYHDMYNDKLRPLTNTETTTVEISPTGSGKTHFYKDSQNTIMLMPTNSMVMQNDGLLSDEQAYKYNTETKIYRTKWIELDFAKCEYMTYDKFYGHIKYEDISSLNIIVDEAHLLLASDNERYQELALMLLNRKYNYKELKLISATIRVESLELFKPHKFDVVTYQRDDFSPHIHFTYQFPKIDPAQRTLIFINSIDKIYIFEKHFKKRYQSINILIIRAGEMLPNEDEIQNAQLILSTSVIKQGYSINNKIDKLIIHNIYNADGAIEILQYMARPRNQTPEVYVVMASTHFDIAKRPEGKDELKIDREALDYIKKQDTASEQTEDTLNTASLLIKSWAKKSNQSQYHGNPVLSNYLYQKEMKNIELYYEDAKAMELIIKEFVPNATIDLIKQLDECESVKFGRIDISEYKSKLEELKSPEEVRSKIKEQIEDINNLKDMDSSDKSRIINKLEKIAKIEPLESFKIDGKTLYFKDEIVVLQMIDEKIYDRCKWHLHNLAYDIYDRRKEKIQSTRRLKVGDSQTISKIDNKFNFLIKPLKASKSIKPLDLLDRLYSFEQYDEAGNLLTKHRSNKAKYVVITSIYPVKDEWFI